MTATKPSKTAMAVSRTPAGSAASLARWDRWLWAVVIALWWRALPMARPGRIEPPVFSRDLSVYPDRMAKAELDVDEVAAALQLSVSLLLRQMRQAPSESELATPESAALARLDRGGPATSSALAKLEQISPQSMGATLSALEARGFIDRRLDDDDGRRILLSITDAGLQALRAKRSQRTKIMSAALSDGFSQAELANLLAAAPLIERLAQKV